MTRRAAIALASTLLTLVLLAPIAAGSHAGGYRTEDYVAGGRIASLVDGVDAPICTLPGTHLSAGGGCFGLDDEPHQIDLSVEDRGRRGVAEVYRQVDPLSPSETPDEVEGLEPDDAFVSGTVRYIDDGEVTLEYTFCIGANDRAVPARVDRIEVVLDGPSAAQANCGDGFTGATTGTIFLTTGW